MASPSHDASDHVVAPAEALPVMPLVAPQPRLGRRLGRRRGHVALRGVRLGVMALTGLSAWEWVVVIGGAVQIACYLFIICVCLHFWWKELR